MRFRWTRKSRSNSLPVNDLATMLETSTLNNVYVQPFNGGRMDDSSPRRAGTGLRNYIQSRRFTIVGRSRAAEEAKEEFEKKNREVQKEASCSSKSSASQSMESVASDEVEDLPMTPQPGHLTRRRMSMPEKSIFGSVPEYAIIRPSSDAESRFEIVTAFNRNIDPYRLYMQTLSCYDLAPLLCCTSMLDAELTAAQTLTCLERTNQPAMLVHDGRDPDALWMLTTSDCLRAIVGAVKGERGLEDCRVKDLISSRKAMTTLDTTSVWDAARLLCVNHVRRLPILQTNEAGQPGAPMYLLTLNLIFLETILKLTDPASQLAPYIRARTLSNTLVGSWGHIHTVTMEDSCLRAMELLLEFRVSSLPVVGARGVVEGIINKRCIMAEVHRLGEKFAQIAEMPVKNVYCPNRSQLISPNATVYDAIRVLAGGDASCGNRTCHGGARCVNGGSQCLFVLDVEGKATAAVSVTDIMNYIFLNVDTVRHKKSVF